MSLSEWTDRQWIQSYNSGLRTLFLTDKLTQDPSFHRFKSQVDSLNYLITFKELPRVEIKILDQSKVNTQKRSHTDTDGVNLSRRSLFFPVKPMLPETHLPHFVAIDSRSCTACDLCLKICPSEALTVSVDPLTQEHVYKLSPFQCDGCGLCELECDSKSISVQEQIGESQLLNILEKTCSHCGNQFHLNPGLVDNNEDLCSVCQKYQHRKGDLRVYDC